MPILAGLLALGAVASPAAPQVADVAPLLKHAQRAARNLDRQGLRWAGAFSSLQRAREHGYDYCLVLENIASLYSSEGFGTEELADRVMKGWKRSPGHRANMLDAEVTDIGVAIAQSEKSRTYYAVQLFGRPHSKRIEFRVANSSPVAVDYDLNGLAYTLPPRSTRTHQECRAVRLTMRLPGERQSTTVQPGDGDRYEIERLGPRYRLKRG